MVLPFNLRSPPATTGARRCSAQRTSGYAPFILDGKEIQSGGASGGAPIADERLAPLDEIACDGCGRSVMSTDGPSLIAVIVGPCPDCGGTFHLVRLAGKRL